ncbi:MAG: glycosyltransferase family 39 protein [Anaerolineae bacterium]|nr:glycosyltransferase family 39 protein [Anaerolineae bacterium]
MAARKRQGGYYARAVLLLLLTGWGTLRLLVLLPPLEGTDEVAHFGYIAYVRQHGQLPPLTTDNPIVLQQTGQPPLYYLLLSAWSLLDAEYDWHTWQGRPPANPWADFNKPVQTWQNVNQFLLGRGHPPLASSPGVERMVWWLRLPSLWMGLLALAGGLAAARRLFPPGTALLAALLFGGTITLLYIFSFITNDSLVTLCGIALTWGSLRLLQRPRPRLVPELLLWGAVAAVGVVSKAGGVLFLPVLAAALLLAPHPQPWRQRWRHGLVLFALPGLAGLAWYGYMLLTYGDPLGAAAHLNRSWVRPEPLGLLEGLVQDDWLSFRTLWGGMGGGYLLPQNWIFAGPLLALLLAGWGMVRGVRRRAFAGAGRVVLLLALTAGLLLLAYARWRTQFYVLSGRLMLPGYLAFILLLVLALRQVPWQRVLRPLLAVWAGVVTLVYAAALSYPLAFTVPLLPPDEVPPLAGVPVQYGAVELLGYRLLPAQLTPETVPQVLLCWRSLAADPLPVPYAFTLQIAGPDDTIYARRESYPGMGQYTLWQPGRAFCDRFTPQRVIAPVPARAYRVLVNLVAPDGGERLPPANGSGMIGRVAAPGPALTAAEQSAAAAELEGLLLLTATAQRVEGRITIQAAWGTAAGWSPRPVTVFWHVMAGDVLLAGYDEPLLPQYPADLWGPAERTGRATYTLSLPEAAAGQPLTLYAGVYLADGQRLSITRSRFASTPDQRLALPITAGE